MFAESIFPKTFDEKHWMKDKEFKMYSLFKNKEENFCVWKRLNDSDEDSDDEDNNINACYHFGSSSTSEKTSIIDVFASFSIKPVKNGEWNMEWKMEKDVIFFDEFFECENEKGGAKDNSIFNDKNEKTKEMLFIQFDE